MIHAESEQFKACCCNPCELWSIVLGSGSAISLTRMSLAGRTCVVESKDENRWMVWIKYPWRAQSMNKSMYITKHSKLRLIKKYRQLVISPFSVFLDERDSNFSVPFALNSREYGALELRNFIDIP